MFLYKKIISTDLLSATCLCGISMFHSYPTCDRWICYDHNTISINCLEASCFGTKFQDDTILDAKT